MFLAVQTKQSSLPRADGLNQCSLGPAPVSLGWRTAGLTNKKGMICYHQDQCLSMEGTVNTELVLCGASSFKNKTKTLNLSSDIAKSSEIHCGALSLFSSGTFPLTCFEPDVRNQCSL